jgi:hypothetical protein
MQILQLARKQMPAQLVAQAVLNYKQRVEEGGWQPATYTADIFDMMESLSKAVKSPGRSSPDPSSSTALVWLLKQALTLVHQSHDGVSSKQMSSQHLLPIQDLCGLAYRLPRLGEALRSQANVLPLAEAVAQHAAARIQQGDAPPIVRSWCDMIYGLTKAGLVANINSNASQGAVKQHSPHLQQLLDVAAQQLPSVLQSQGAMAQDVSLTLLSYAYAGYTGDLGPVTQALASNLEGCLQSIEPQHAGNIVWALGKLCELRQQEGQQVSMQPAGCNQKLFSYLLGELCRQLGEARSQAISNAVYGCALAGHVEGVPQLLDSVCQQPQVMAGADPQHWANTLWAIATMYETAAGQDHQEGLAGQLQHSGHVLIRALLMHPQVFDHGRPQHWSNALWAAAKLGCVEPGSQLLERLATQAQTMPRWNPQDWSNNIWAAATLYQTAVDTSSGAADQLQKGGHLLFQACASSPTGMQGAVPQSWSNTLWAAAVLRWYDQCLFSQGAAALAGAPPAEVKPQHISNSLYACALCAHWDHNVQQLMGRLQECDLAAFSAQDLTNTLYAWAVLSCVVATSGASQQHLEALSRAAAPLFKEAAQRDVNTFGEKGLRQLYAAHIHAEHLGIPGLPAGAVLEAARAAGWTDGKAIVSAGQREVASALQQLRYTTQLEMRSPDEMMSADIGVTALPNGRPCSIAVEFDGPTHFVTEYSSGSNNRAAPVDRLNGPTRLRNALLQARFPDGVVCIPWKEWVAAGEAGQQGEYARAALSQVAGEQVSPPSNLVLLVDLHVDLCMHTPLAILTVAHDAMHLLMHRNSLASFT